MFSKTQDQAIDNRSEPEGRSSPAPIRFAKSLTRI